MVNNKIKITDIIFVVLSVFYAIGMRMIFPVCQVMEDNVMACHWAGEVLKALSIVMIVLSVLHLVLPDEHTKIGISLSIMVNSVLMALVPGHLIAICMMSTMHCHTTSLVTLIISIIFVLCCLVDVVLNRQSLSNKAHSRF